MKRIRGQLGLSAKAGRIVSGEFSVEKAVKEGRAYLVIIAEDASENTKKHFRDMCSFRNIPIRFLGTKDELGHSIGKESRASVALTDEGFAKSILKKTDVSNY